MVVDLQQSRRVQGSELGLRLRHRFRAAPVQLGNVFGIERARIQQSMPHTSNVLSYLRWRQFHLVLPCLAEHEEVPDLPVVLVAVEPLFLGKNRCVMLLLRQGLLLGFSLQVLKVPSCAR